MTEQFAWRTYLFTPLLSEWLCSPWLASLSDSLLRFRLPGEGKSSAATCPPLPKSAGISSACSDLCASISYLQIYVRQNSITRYGVRLHPIILCVG